MSKYLLLFFCMAVIGTANAQTSIRGTVRDTIENKPLRNAVVALVGRRKVDEGHEPKLIRTVFWSSKVPTHYKFHLLAYAASYIAIGFSLPGALALYFVQGWFGPWLLPFFVSTFEYWVVSLVIFGATGLLGVTIARHRSGDANIFRALTQFLLWYPINLITIVSLSIPLAKAMVSFLVSIPVSFGVTAKDDSNFHFAKEAPLVLRHFWQSSTICLAIVAGVSVLATSAVPITWQIADWPTMQWK